MSASGNAPRRDELVALYDGQGVAEDMGRIVCLRLFTGMGPRIAL